jgi:chromosome segregation ATPase
MNGLSEAASILTVKSIAIQLAGTLQKLDKFFQNASADMNSLAKDLKFLGEVLKDIEEDDRNHGPDGTTQKILESSRTKVKGLQETLESSDPGFNSKAFRKQEWTAVRVDSKKGTIAKIQRSLEELKLTIVFARHCSS